MYVCIVCDYVQVPPVGLPGQKARWFYILTDTDCINLYSQEYLYSYILANPGIIILIKFCQSDNQEYYTSLFPFRFLLNISDIK